MKMMMWDENDKHDDWGGGGKGIVKAIHKYIGI